MSNMEAYRNEIKRVYILFGSLAEERNKQHIEWLWEQKHITYSQKEHLEKFNKNLGKAFK